MDKILITIDKLAELRRKTKGGFPVVSVFFVLIAFVIRYSLIPLMGISVPFLLFPVAIILSASVEGVLGGLVATLISAVLGHIFFLTPIGEFGYKGPVDIVTLVIFALVGIAITIMTEARNRVESLNVSLLEKEHKARLEATFATKIRDRFISVTSHELKTPLTNIKIYVQLLQQNPKHSKLEEILGKIDDQINNMTLFINDLLDTAKMKEGKIKMNKNRFDLNQLVISIIDNFKQTGRHISLHGKLSKTIMADKQRIGQVLNNLLTNALKYSGGDITVLLSEQDGFAKITVQDSGVGISKNDQQRIFQPFFRISERVSQPDGLGLGLYIASEIVKQNGGKIQVQSAPNKGSSFTVTIPFGIPRR